jgi:hypothetical protein
MSTDAIGPLRYTRDRRASWQRWLGGLPKCDPSQRGLRRMNHIVPFSLEPLRYSLASSQRDQA